MFGVDEFAAFRYLVTQRNASALIAEPELQYEFGKGIVRFRIRESYQWIVVNVDFIDDKPLPRKSYVLFHCEENKDGFCTFQIPPQLVDQVERIGVFYGTGNGPSSEAYIERKPAAR